VARSRKKKEVSGKEKVAGFTRGASSAHEAYAEEEEGIKGVRGRGGGS